MADVIEIEIQRPIIESNIIRSPIDAELERISPLIYTSGSTNYNDLFNKPQINTVTLVGNRSLPDIGVSTLSNLEIRDILT